MSNVTTPATHVERKRIYLACRAIFTDQNAEVRRQKVVIKLVKKHEAHLKSLIDQFGRTKLVETLQQLLEARVFESESHAKLAFPELFQATPKQNVQMEAPKIDTTAPSPVVSANVKANSRSESSDEGKERGSSPLGGKEAGEQTVRGDGQGQPLLAGSLHPEETPPQPTRSPTTATNPPDMPSLYPSRLPYSAQHAILTAAQRILEESCYEFARLWLPDLVQRRGWDCPEAVELNKWESILHGHDFCKNSERDITLHPDALDLKGASSLAHVFVPVARLRHTAVHRQEVTVREVAKLLQGAVTLAETLKDDARAARLETLRLEVDGKIKVMELKKNVLQDRTARELADLRRRRAELERMEGELVCDMLDEDRRNGRLLGRLLVAATEEVLEGGTQRSEARNEGRVVEGVRWELQFPHGEGERVGLASVDTGEGADLDMMRGSHTSGPSGVNGSHDESDAESDMGGGGSSLD